MARRREVLQMFGAHDSIVDEVLAYTDKAGGVEMGERVSFPLQDEAHLDAWTAYARDATEAGAFQALRRRLIQLRIPVRHGISEEDAYRDAVRKGAFEAAEAYAPGLVLKQPSGLSLQICHTIAGRIPVLSVRDRDDFVALVQAFTDRHEPVPVPAAMGACIVKGLVNWDRVAAYRRAWEAGQRRSEQSSDGQPGDRGIGEATGDAWASEFRRFAANKSLYQDMFVISSTGPYSAIRAADAGYSEDEWLERSIAIRHEHEVTHYFTFRLFGSFRSHLFDELIADFVGLVRGTGTYRAELALRCLGLETYPAYQGGGRVEVYRGTPPLSDEAFKLVCRLVVESARHLEAVAHQEPGLASDMSRLAELTYALNGLTLEEIAAGAVP